MAVTGDRVRRYSELVQLPTFAERFAYAKLDGVVGADTFGSNRYLNQAFYHGREWRNFRNYIIARDKACDLAMEGYELTKGIHIHHLNPIEVTDILEATFWLMNPEFVVTTFYKTHEAITYGSEYTPEYKPVYRQAFDTCPWKGVTANG